MACTIADAKVQIRAKIEDACNLVMGPDDGILCFDFVVVRGLLWWPKPRCLQTEQLSSLAC
jgi:hypothetical protein